MACQGCGRVSEKRLCCPTCIEFGRTSFFCGQECFTTNWNAHNQLHELMRRKQGVVEGGTPAGLDAGPLEVVPPSAVASSGAAGLGGGGGGGGASGSRGGGGGSSSFASSASGGSGGGFAPLAGGTSIVNLSGQKRSSTSAPLVPAAAAGGSAAGGGIFGSLVGHARAVLGDSGAAATSALKSRLGGGGGSGALRARSPAPNRSGGSAAGRTRSHSRDSGRPAGQPAPKTRSFNVQLSLWALVILCVTASMLFYREHERYVADQPSQVELADAQVAVPPAPTAVRSSEVSSEVVAAVTAVAEAIGIAAPADRAVDGTMAAAPAVAAAAVAAAAGGEAASADLAEKLRSEMKSLREMVERHDQMLRYIMDRYVEKNVSGKEPLFGAGATSAADHEAAQVNLAKPEFESKSFGEPAVEKTAARGNDVLRKRKGGGGEVGLPTLER
mmetsp:Transcript_90668/g.292619  ORF Transcript_90668/g.292619 Transcript_90668/m.292619 type:complete len:443 (-) Transcript_90668:76-1404(-)